MHPTSLSFIFLTLLPFLVAHAAITTPINRNGDYVEENARGRFCYYPKAVDPASIDVACVGSKADLASVMQAQLSQTTSINYFSASLQRLGGADWVVDVRGRKIYLCLSGRAGDFTYQTMCTTVTRDNSLGNSTSCKVETGQTRVTDGCYVPNQPIPTFTIASTPRPAVVTVTRTSGSVVTATRVSESSSSLSKSNYTCATLRNSLLGALSISLLVLIYTIL